MPALQRRSDDPPLATSPSPDPSRVALALAEDRGRTVLLLEELTGNADELVAATVSSNADDEHDPEGSTIAYERSQLGALLNQSRKHLAEIDAACTRLAEGRYGACERCGRPIAPERLEARPVARTCVVCVPR
jgi:RNA polymerase-binding transcription factor DksA